MPWQRDAVDVACEFDPDTGLPYYGEVNLIVMRQQGKTTIELASLVDRFVSFTDRQRCVYSAQSGNDARKKLIEDWAPAIRQSPLSGIVDKVVQANGHESIRCKTGSFVETMASLEASGHGFSVHFGMIDEAWKDHDDRREQAMDPAMLTIPDAQKWVVSTAGNDASTYLRRKVEAGRQAASEDRGFGICYIEYAVPDDEDPFDLDVMLRYMPALCRTPGPCTCSHQWRHTVTQEALQTRMQGMEPDEARRAYGNQWISGGGERVIPAELWDQVQDPDTAPEGRVTFAVDVNVDQASASIAVSDGEQVEVIVTREGVSWLVDWFTEKPERRRFPVAVDAGGPVSSVIDELERAGVRLERRSGPDVAAACGRMFNAVADGEVRVRPSSAELDAAVAGVATKPVGDKFVWSRQTSSADVTPLMAVTLAFAAGPPKSPGIAVIDY